MRSLALVTTIAEAAERYGLTERLIRRGITTGAIRHRRAGSTLLLYARDVARLAETPPPPRGRPPIRR